MTAGFVSSLKNDMITDILARLPVKSLLRYRSVSNFWFFLITNSRFIAIHLHQSTKNSSLIFPSLRKQAPKMLYHSEPTTPHDVHIPSSMEDDSIQIKGSSGGLLYMRLGFCCFWYNGLWNPATRQFNNVKCPQQPISILSEGFGHSSKINDYKLVRIGYFLRPHSPHDSDSDSDEDAIERRVDSVVRALVLSWKTDSWITVEDGALLSGCYEDHVCAKGELYWEVIVEGNLANKELILAFDIANEAFIRIQMPVSNQTKPQFSRKLTGYKDSLALLIYPKESAETCFDLWLLNGNGGDGNSDGWSKLFTVGRMSKIAEPVSAWRGEIIMKSLEEEDSYFLYDPIQQGMNNISISSAGFYWFRVYEYAETLVSVEAPL